MPNESVVLADYEPAKNCCNEDSCGCVCIKCGMCGREFINGFLQKDSADIKPCPVCGKELEVVYIGGGWFWRHKIDPPYPLCPIACSRKYSTREEVIREMNRRADNES